MRYDKLRKLARNELLTDYKDSNRVSFEKVGGIFRITRQRAHQIYQSQKKREVNDASLL